MDAEKLPAAAGHAAETEKFLAQAHSYMQEHQHLMKPGCSVGGQEGGKEGGRGGGCLLAEQQFCVTLPAKQRIPETCPDLPLDAHPTGTSRSGLLMFLCRRIL